MSLIFIAAAPAMFPGWPPMGAPPMPPGQPPPATPQAGPAPGTAAASAGASSVPQQGTHTVMLLLSSNHFAAFILIIR